MLAGPCNQDVTEAIHNIPVAAVPKQRPVVKRVQQAPFRPSLRRTWCFRTRCTRSFADNGYIPQRVAVRAQALAREVNLSLATTGFSAPRARGTPRHRCRRFGPSAASFSTVGPVSSPITAEGEAKETRPALTRCRPRQLRQTALRQPAPPGPHRSLPAIPRTR